MGVIEVDAAAKKAAWSIPPAAAQECCLRKE